jgi:hypothetical protein
MTLPSESAPHGGTWSWNGFRTSVARVTLVVVVVGRGAHDVDTWCVKRDVACIDNPLEGNLSLSGSKVVRYDSMKDSVGSSSSPLSNTLEFSS